MMGFATAWFAFDFVGAATVISRCFQPAFDTEMNFDRSLQNWVSGHEMVLLFLVSVIGVCDGHHVVPGSWLRDTSDPGGVRALFLGIWEGFYRHLVHVLSSETGRTFLHSMLCFPPGGLVKDKESGKGICFSRKWFMDIVVSQALIAACLAAAEDEHLLCQQNHLLFPFDRGRQVQCGMDSRI